MTRVIHTGDTHLGYRQYHSPERRSDFLSAFRQVIEDAIATEVDAVIHAGDLFHDRRPSLDDLLDTIDVLGMLSDAEIPFLAIVGNHEGTRGRQWLDLLQTLGFATRLDETGVVVGDTTFYGLDFVPPSQRDRLEYAFAPSDTPYTALVSHGLFDPFAHADWDTEHLIESSNVDFDVLLLGDNHEAGQSRVLETWVTYCGSTERTSASERGERGYNLVEFGETIQISRRGIDTTREFVFVDVALGPSEGVERVTEQIQQYDITDAVVLVSLTGDGERVTPAEIEQFAIDNGALVARVTDHREIETETTINVSFADPDQAVRERVHELGLSGAARDVDEIVRESKIADSNVRPEVEQHVRSLLSDGYERFETADDATGSDADVVTPTDDEFDQYDGTDRSPGDTRGIPAPLIDEPSTVDANGGAPVENTDHLSASGGQSTGIDRPTDAPGDDAPSDPTNHSSTEEKTTDDTSPDKKEPSEQTDQQTSIGEF